MKLCHLQDRKPSNARYEWGTEEAQSKFAVQMAAYFALGKDRASAETLGRK